MYKVSKVSTLDSVLGFLDEHYLGWFFVPLK